MSWSSFFSLWSAVMFGWTPQVSNTSAGLRGLHALSPPIVWASGTQGTYLVTHDGGSHWQPHAVPSAEALDFRTVQVLDTATAYLLSSGEGPHSKLYGTIDGGAHWTLLFTNPDAKGFLDALAFWDTRHGIILGDPVDGYFAVFTTSDSGSSWNRQNGPAALPDEGAFAASGTCLIAKGSVKAWFGTGGPGAARVFRTSDRGHTWAVSQTAVRNDSKSAGIFSLAFQDELHGEAVGGDYQKPKDAVGTTALTSDGGQTWNSPPGSAATGYRSSVIFVPRASRTLIAVGTSGTDISRDGGQTWSAFSSESFNALSAAPDGTVWAAGPHGRLSKLTAMR